MNGTPDYGLVMAFDTDDPEFVRGFEIGRLYEMTQRCPEPFEQTVHASNTEMIIRLGEASGRHMSASEIPETDDWLSVTVAATVLPARASSSQPDCSHGTAGMSRCDSTQSACRHSRACRSLTFGTTLLFGASGSLLVGLIARLYIGGARRRENFEGTGHGD